MNFTVAKDPRQILVIALGDPAGIGMEVVLKALASRDLPKSMKPILVGCRSSLLAVHNRLKQQTSVPLADPRHLIIDDQPLQMGIESGVPSTHGGEAGFRWLTRAVKLLQDIKGRALVTAPIAKHLWYAAGHEYPGQTERLAELAGSNRSSMLFTAVSPYTGWRLNTLLATTHIPLYQIPQALTPELVNHKLTVLLDFCRRFQPCPHLVIAGLNPHAGESGRLGFEEISWLTPLVLHWRNRHPEVRLDGPVSPDTCWLSAARAWQHKNQQGPDGILALYHDQGLIPVKLMAFDAAVNATLELPFLRTSPDHGTGFDIATQGTARPDSMIAAIRAAWELSLTQVDLTRIKT
ncbi:4-hydroxythreonine-4-phosphate dehydrogenase PdxA [Synechococcus sp. M16CYN]|uniref:4-hydroxythreonine-4-phosphate dehydrogenase PdxA n=1 Tax=Synechococcus sp. M16CYN TaxID=3103139 RepID=UPI003248678B